MDKGTSESSLLGAGSPLPSIPFKIKQFHRLVLYCTVSVLWKSERKGENYILHFDIDRDPHSFRHSRHYGLIVPT